VPNFVAVGKMLRKPLVPATVGVRQNPNSFHYSSNALSFKRKS
jgi:hypothetical protein